VQPVWQSIEHNPGRVCRNVVASCNTMVRCTHEGLTGMFYRLLLLLMCLVVVGQMVGLEVHTAQSVCLL
jgi:hypothetical protein